MSKKRRDLERDIIKLESEDNEQFKFYLDKYVGLQAKERETIRLKQLTEAQQKLMSVQHYTLHLPATLTKEQLQFIMKIAKAVEENKPIIVVHEEAMQFLLRLAYTYRNILEEFDEKRRWTTKDESNLVRISKGFEPILEWLKEQYKLNIKEFEWK